MKKRIVGIDYGQARIGVAISDPSQTIASPLRTILQKGKPQEAILELHSLLEDYDIEAIVIGLPLQMNGKIGFSAENVLSFIEKLKESFSYPILTWDERLTTVQVERSMKEDSMSRKKRTKVIDKACAALILQNYLDQKLFSIQV